MKNLIIFFMVSLTFPALANHNDEPNKRLRKARTESGHRPAVDEPNKRLRAAQEKEQSKKKEPLSFSQHPLFPKFTMHDFSEELADLPLIYFRDRCWKKIREKVTYHVIEIGSVYYTAKEAKAAGLPAKRVCKVVTASRKDFYNSIVGRVDNKFSRPGNGREISWGALGNVDLYLSHKVTKTGKVTFQLRGSHKWESNRPLPERTLFQGHVEFDVFGPSNSPRMRILKDPDGVELIGTYSQYDENSNYRYGYMKILIYDKPVKKKGYTQESDVWISYFPEQKNRIDAAELDEPDTAAPRANHPNWVMNPLLGPPKF